MNKEVNYKKASKIFNEILQHVLEKDRQAVADLLVQLALIYQKVDLH